MTEHEANIIFKDNDLNVKIRLHPEHAFHVIDIINKDSDFLHSMGIMDYSLLIGIKNQQYHVDNNTGMMIEEGGSRLSTSQLFRRTCNSNRWFHRKSQMNPFQTNQMDSFGINTSNSKTANTDSVSVTITAEDDYDRDTLGDIIGNRYFNRDTLDESSNRTSNTTVEATNSSFHAMNNYPARAVIAPVEYNFMY